MIEDPDFGAAKEEDMDNDSLIISHLTLRRALGSLGIALPFILAIVGYVVFGAGLQDSISDYYHTGMRDVFVGIIVSIGIFLAAYTGYEDDAPLGDNLVANVASLGAIVLALFPTAPSAGPNPLPPWVGVVHWIFSALFFLALAYFCLFLFTRTHPDRAPSPEKLMRNTVYRTCGVVIVACLVLIALNALLPLGLGALKPVFWLESAAVIAFGVAWLVKGETLLADPS